MFDIQAEWVKSKCANYERDNIVEAVKEKLTNRSMAGIKKYGTTIWSNTDENYLKHLQDELLDGANYCEQQIKLGNFIKDVVILIESLPNDSNLGKSIRSLYTQYQENAINK
jgi:hypothetical protein